MENNNISFDSQIGRDKKSNKGKIIALVVAVVVIVAAAVGYYIYRKASITEIAIGLSDIELTDELKSQMQDLAVKSEEYLKTNKNEKTLTSQYGLLYSYKDKINIMADDIDTENTIPTDIVAEMDVLYVMPSDVISSMTGNELTIFVSLNSSSGYYVTSATGENAIFTEDEFKNILMKYAPTHGDVRNPQRGSDEHTAIIDAAGLAGDDIDIKHIACDDKYAVVVANHISDPANIKEVALENDNGWKVTDGELAVSENSYIEINSVYPDMDLGLLPVYNIADFGEIQTDKMGEIADSLIELGMMTEDEKNGMYACGCGRFAYIQPKDGRRLIGYISDDKQLEFNEAKDIKEAIAYMVQCQENPPVFIARFE